MRNCLKSIDAYVPSAFAAWQRVSDPEFLKLDWNESDLDWSLEFGALYRGTDVKRLVNWYPPVDMMPLKASLSAYTGLPARNIEVFAGSDSAQESIVKALLEDGSAIAMFSPGYENFRLLGEVSGHRIHPIALNDDFSFPYDRLETHLSSHKINLTYIISPHNPSGMIVDKVAVLALVERFPDTYFLLDEAYFEFSGQTFATEIPNHPNLLVTRSFSKAFSLAGLRLGYVLASEQIIQALALVRNTKQVSYFASQFGPMVLERVDKVMAHVERVRANRASFRKVATAGGRFHIPESQANFLLFQFPTVEERAIIIDRLAQLKAQVRVVGSGLLKKNLLRVSIIGSFEMGPISEIFR